MNSINILHSHSYSKDDAFVKAEKMLEELADKYGLEVEHDGEGHISFSGSGITGTVAIEHNEVHFTATLSFLMIAMKSVISSEIKRKLDNIFD